MLRGSGTALNIATVLVGSGVGVALRSSLPERTRTVVTDGLGLVTLLVAGLNAVAVTDPALRRAVGSSGVLIVLAAVLLGGIAGSLLQVESRLEALGGWLQRRLGAGGSAGRARFVEGFVASSLVFCVGPLTILGALSDGLGRGIDQLALKSTLDGFAAVAFAAAYGWGVAASAGTVLVVQGSLTVVGLLLGGLLPAAQIAAVTATGGVLLGGVGLRLLGIRQVPVGDLLPALLAAPLITLLVTRLG